MPQGLQQGSVLRPLLFLLFINDFKKVVVHSKVRYFPNDANVLYVVHSLKNLKAVNFDLSNLVQWLTTNKICLKANKTEIVVFSSPTKPIYKNLNFRLSGQNDEPKRCIKYLGVIINEHLNTFKQNLNRANDILMYYVLAKLMCYVTPDEFKFILPFFTFIGDVHANSVDKVRVKHLI